MGTNFYLKNKPPCDHCGQGVQRRLHIGKSSGGWAFTLHVYPDGVDHMTGVPAPRDLAEWIPLFDQGVVNEYGGDISAAEMFAIITNRSRFRPGGCDSLLRHSIDGFCIAHGEGTWDLCVGDFS